MISTLTPQHVTAALRKAGFERATSFSSPIRGLKSWSDGYEVKGWNSRPEGGWQDIAVNCHMLNSRLFPEEVAKELDAWEAALIAEGYAVRVSGRRLLVSIAPERGGATP